MPDFRLQRSARGPRGARCRRRAPTPRPAGGGGPRGAPRGECPSSSFGPAPCATRGVHPPSETSVLPPALGQPLSSPRSHLRSPKTTALLPYSDSNGGQGPETKDRFVPEVPLRQDQARRISRARPQGPLQAHADLQQAAAGPRKALPAPPPRAATGPPWPHWVPPGEGPKHWSGPFAEGRGSCRGISLPSRGGSCLDLRGPICE